MNGIKISGPRLEPWRRLFSECSKFVTITKNVIYTSEAISLVEGARVG